MTTITLKGNPLHTVGDLPTAGSTAPNFTLTKNDLSDVSFAEFKGKKLVLNIFPSVDTPTCALSVERFNSEVSKFPNTTILCISADLPFAQKRFCGAKNLENVVTLSTFRHPDFGSKYGVTISEGPLKGLLSRAVVVVDEHGKIIYIEQVAELSAEPNYAAALTVL